LLKDSEDNLILASNRYAEFHKDILKEERKLNTNPLVCLGGGRLKISDDEIYAYGYSMDFGKPPSDLVEEILNEIADGKTVRVEIGKGY